MGSYGKTGTNQTDYITDYKEMLHMVKQINFATDKLSEQIPLLQVQYAELSFQAATAFSPSIAQILQRARANAIAQQQVIAPLAPENQCVNTSPQKPMDLQLKSEPVIENMNQSPGITIKTENKAHVCLDTIQVMDVDYNFDLANVKTESEENGNIN